MVPVAHQQLAVEEDDRAELPRRHRMRIDLQNLAVLRQDKKRSCAAAIFIGTLRGDEVDAVVLNAKVTVSGHSPLAPH